MDSVQAPVSPTCSAETDSRFVCRILEVPSAPLDLPWALIPVVGMQRGVVGSGGDMEFLESTQVSAPLRGGKQLWKKVSQRRVYGWVPPAHAVRIIGHITEYRHGRYGV